MNKDLQRLTQSIMDVVTTWGVAIVIIAAGLIFTWQFVGPAPPSRIVLATGAEGGAYRYYGEQFAAYLATQGIETELRETAGSAENLQLLNGGDGADIGFVQGGLSGSFPTEQVVAAGSLYWEPLWLFVRASEPAGSVQQLAGKRIAVGTEGSGTRAVVLNLLAAHGIDGDTADLRALPSDALVDGLLESKVDAVFVIGALNSATVEQLITEQGIRLHSLERAAAYVRLYPYFSRVGLPQGVLDLQSNIPAQDIDTVAVTAMLAANAELHPALFDLLLIAATEIFEDRTLLADAGAFPTDDYIDLPLSDDAERFFKHGPPLLMQYLPFWAATLIDRMWIMLLPLIGLAIPLGKLLPPAYRWRIRRRLLRFYAELESIDPLVSPVQNAADLSDRLTRLEQLDVGSVIGAVPKAYIDDVYKLRRDIDLVRRRLNTNQ
jgi:TRAP transporter TAXI family solute receptor